MEKDNEAIPEKEIKENKISEDISNNNEKEGNITLSETEKKDSNKEKSDSLSENLSEQKKTDEISQNLEKNLIQSNEEEVKQEKEEKEKDEKEKEQKEEKKEEDKKEEKEELKKNIDKTQSNEKKENEDEYNLKGLNIKKTILVRISLFRENDLNDKFKSDSEIKNGKNIRNKLLNNENSSEINKANFRSIFKREKKNLSEVIEYKPSINKSINKEEFKRYENKIKSRNEYKIKSINNRENKPYENKTTINKEYKPYENKSTTKKEFKPFENKSINKTEFKPYVNKSINKLEFKPYENKTTTKKEYKTYKYKSNNKEKNYTINNSSRINKQLLSPYQNKIKKEKISIIDISDSKSYNDDKLINTKINEIKSINQSKINLNNKFTKIQKKNNNIRNDDKQSASKKIEYKKYLINTNNILIKDNSEQKNIRHNIYDNTPKSYGIKIDRYSNKKYNSLSNIPLKNKRITFNKDENIKKINFNSINTGIYETPLKNQTEKKINKQYSYFKNSYQNKKDNEFSSIEVSTINNSNNNSYIKSNNFRINCRIKHLKKMIYDKEALKRGITTVFQYYSGIVEELDDYHPTMNKKIIEIKSLT